MAVLYVGDSLLTYNGHLGREREKKERRKQGFDIIKVR